MNAESAMYSGLDVLELVLGRTRASAQARAAEAPVVETRGMGAGEELHVVMRFLQLLVDDAQSLDGGRTSLGFETARVELDRCDRQAACEALVALLQHALRAAAPADCWLALEAAVLDARAAWRQLDDLRDEQPWLPGPEAAQLGLPHLAEQLLEALAQSTQEPALGMLWRARWLHASGALDEAEVLYRFVATSPPVAASREARAPAAGTVEHARLGKASCAKAGLGEGQGNCSPSARFAAARAVCALHLQRGAVREATAWRTQWRAQCRDLELAESGRSDVGGSGAQDWGYLDGALALAEGNWSAARALFAGVDASDVPLALVEMARALPEVAEALPAASTRAREAVVAARLPLERRSVGAAALVVYAQDDDGGVRSVHADAAVGLRAALAEHAAGREDALALSGSLEARLFAAGRGVVEHAQIPPGKALVGDSHRERMVPIRGAIGHASKAVALEPIVDEAGEPLGWLHLEWEHHLVPPEGVRRNLTVRALELLRASLKQVRSASIGRSPVATAALDARHVHAAASTREHLRVEFEQCIESLGLKWTRRAWRAFIVEDGAPTEVHRGGALDAFGLEALPARAEAETCAASGGKALARALAWRTCAGFETPDAQAALSPSAKSGVVLPLDLGGRVVGAIAIESQHVRDFRDFDGHALQHRLAGRVVGLRLAAFRDDHRRRQGWAPGFDARRADLLSFATRLAEVARSRCVLAISGEHGSGKSVVARWTHFEGGSARGPFVVQPAGGGPLDWPRLLRAAQGGTLVVDQLESMGDAEQRRFLQVLDGQHLEDERPLRVSGARIVVCCLEGLARLAADGRLRPDLAARLARYELVVPPLRRRRADIPVLFTAMLARFAEEEGCHAPEVAEEALAVLFRQDHPGNLRDLEAVAQRLVVHERGGVVTAADLERVAREHGWKLAPRIASRHPRVEDIRDALWSTRMQSGRTNKTRAALWLGWDPDTLVARMADLGIPDEVEPRAAWQAPEGAVAPDSKSASGQQDEAEM